MPIKRFYLGLLILFSAPALNGRAQNASTFSSALSGDSVFYRPTPSQSWREITSVPVPLMLGGYLISPAKEAVQNLRHNFIAGGRVTRADDYLQYAPILLTLGLKIGGYRGRSGWGRMLTADAFSVALMAGLVNGLKYGIREERPDGADNRSFPSGHTATAFMAATWLHKEYGQTRSIWFSVGGYATAVSVGVMRIVNNKHWINDVLFGAGLGIFSAELGYYLADLIFKEKGLRCGLKPWAQSEDGRDAAGFAALNLGVDVPLNSGGGGDTYKTEAFTGVEGGYFLHPYWGVGGELNASACRYAARANGYFRIKLHPVVCFGVKAGAGYSFMVCGKEHAADMGAGVSLNWRLAPHFTFGLFSDYYFSVSPHSRRHSLMAGGSARFLIP